MSEVPHIQNSVNFQGDYHQKFYNKNFWISFELNHFYLFIPNQDQIPSFPYVNEYVHILILLHNFDFFFNFCFLATITVFDICIHNCFE
jgi:hypothetical protein